MTTEEQIEMRAVTDLVADRLKNLLIAHYEALHDLATGEDNEGVVKIGCTIELDYSGENPVGAVNISFARRIKDGATFIVAPHPELPLTDRDGDALTPAQMAAMKTLSSI